MKKTFLAIGSIFIILFASIAVATPPNWSSATKIDRLSYSTENGWVFVIIEGTDANNVACKVPGGVSYFKYLASTDPDKILYSTLLSLYVSGGKALLGAPGGTTSCDLVTVETCGSETSCPPF